MTAASGTGTRGSGTAGREVALVTGAGVLAAALSLVLAPLGATVLYGLGGLLALGLFLRAVRWEVLPPLRAAVDRVRPRPVCSTRPARFTSVGPVLVVAVAVGLTAFAVAGQGLLALAALTALLLVTVAVWLCWPLLHDLVTHPPEDVPDAARRPSRPLRVVVGRRGRMAVTVAAVALIGPVAIVLGSLGPKLMVAGVGAAVVVLLIRVVRDRSVCFTFLAVASLAFMLHKSLGPQDVALSSGAISVYVTTFDAMLVLLYAFWIREGTFAADARAGFRRPIVRIPLVAVLFLLPSLLVAPQPWLGAGELVRMAWMYLLFFYVAVRVRTRRHVWAVLGGLAVFAAFELLVVLGQWLTGGNLGLAFLGVPAELTQRISDAESLGRPFGTIIHPVFMGAVLGSLCLVALSLAIHLPRSLAKVAAGVMVLVCAVPLYLAHARAAVLAVAITSVYVVATGIARGRLQWSSLGRLALLGCAVGTVFLPQLAQKFSENFFTAHFWEEIDSRLQLNGIALEMWDDHWGLGVGLNNFEVVLPRYEEHFVIFFGNPVHNLYLLYLSETGAIGLVGLLLAGVAMFWAAVRAARSPDPLLGGTSIGIVAMMIFLALEEQLGFSLRQDVPLAVYWLLAGLAVACARIGAAGPPPADAVEARRPRRPPRPPREPVPASGSGTGVRPTPRTASALDRTRLDSVSLVAAAGVRTARARLAGSIRTLLRPLGRTGGGAARRGPLVPLFLAAVLSVGAVPAATASRAAEAATEETGEQAAPGTEDAGEHAGVEETGGMADGEEGGDEGGDEGEAATDEAGEQAAPAAEDAAEHAAVEEAGVEEAGEVGLAIVFEAEVRDSGEHAIFTAATDGTVRRISPSDGRQYTWPRWAFGNRKIVFTSRAADAGDLATRIEIMNPDGSGREVISSFDFVVGQPRVDSSGTSLFFTAAPPWFPDNAIFRMDLRTLESQNLTGVTSPIGGLDADPALSPDGRTLFLVSGHQDHADVTQMSVDGTARRAVTDDAYWNTDPDVSPDGRTLAISSYRGPDTPSQGGLVARPDGFHLALHDLASGSERVLTAGVACALRPPSNPCAVHEMSAYAPRFSPDGTLVAFTGALDGRTTCICAIGAGGGEGRPLISRTDLAISWFDFHHDDSAGGWDAIGAGQRSSRLLVTMAAGEGSAAALVEASPDLMHRTEIALPSDLNPVQARWSPDRTQIVFTARVPVPRRAAAPHPAPPAGESRREHVTLADLDPVTYAMRSVDPPVSAEAQVFLREADGSVRALTDPWIEDWRDGVRLGDARSNSDPVFTADGRAVIVTNTSTLTGESFLLRIDLRDGSVLNLTNATAGALPVDDRASAPSPDGDRVAFAWTSGATVDIYTMRPDGSGVRGVTASDEPDGQPTWLPAGEDIVSVSERNGGSVLVRTSVATGRQAVLVPPRSTPVTRPVAAPEGDRLLFLGRTISNLTVSGVGLQGGGAPFVLQPDPLHQHLDLDWR